MRIYLDGEFVSKQEAKVSVFDHGLLYGDGVFEGLRVYDGRIFRLARHLDRLYRSAKGILLQIPVALEEMAGIIEETVRQNGLPDAYIRLVVTRGVGDLGLDPDKCERPSIIVIVEQLRLWPREYYENGIALVTSTTRRTAPEAVDPSIKTLNYLNNIMARSEGKKAGVQEIMMLNQHGRVCEGSADNLFIVVKDELWTPPISAGVLEGITRDAIMELGRAQGVVVREELFHRQQVYTAQECFLTGTAAEVIAVVEVDERRIGDGKPGPVTLRFAGEFAKLTRNEGNPVL